MTKITLGDVTDTGGGTGGGGSSTDTYHTLAVMKARIATELGRTNLTSQIAEAISSAILEMQKERFRFSDADPANPPAFNTVPGRWIYDATDNGNIATIYRWDDFNLLLNGELYKLDPLTPEEVKTYNETGSGQGFPTGFAYEGNKILLSPVPDQVYAMSFSGSLRIPAPLTDTEIGNFWMTDGELLIRSRAKYEIATHVTRNPVMAQAMSPLEPGATWMALRSLKGEAARATGLGRVRVTQW